MACRCVQYNVDCGPTYFRMINLFKQFSPTAVSEEVLPICICKAKACVAVDCRGGTVGVLQSGCGGKVRGKRLPGTKGFSQPPNPNHKYDMYCLCCGCACGPFGNLKLPAKKTRSWRKIHVVICSLPALLALQLTWITLAQEALQARMARLWSQLRRNRFDFDAICICMHEYMCIFIFFIFFKKYIYIYIILYIIYIIYPSKFFAGYTPRYFTVRI